MKTMTIHASSPEALRDAFVSFIGAAEQRYEIELRSHPSAQRAKIITAIRAELQLINAFLFGVKIECPAKRIRNRTPKQ